jgi:TolB-like protein/tetratricopeptide (TPR) repeat protein
VATSSQAPDSGQVQLALERITQSAAFSRSERLCRLLRFVTERTLAGRGNELKEYLIGVEVLEKGSSFDPRLDSAVRVDARRLRAKLYEYYAGDGAEDPVRIVLNKGSYAPSFEWPAKRAEQPPVAVAPPVRRRIHPIPVVLGLLAVMGLTAGWWVWHRNPESTSIRSIAVLPFTNITGRAENDTLCDGLAVEMTNRFAKLPGLRVVSRSSAFAYKGKHVDARRVARELRVDSILEGGVRENNNSLRITVRLVRGEDGSQLWSDSFDLTKGDDLGLQASIGQTVEARVAQFIPGASSYTGAVSPRDRELDMLVVQAKHLAQRSSSESILRAIEYAGRSVAERPKSAPAYVVLGDAWLALAGQRLGDQRAEAVEHARRNAATAAELDSTLAAPLTTLGAIAMDYEWRWREAEELFRRATVLNPSNGSAFARYARLLTLQGRHDDAIAQARHAETLAPTSVNVIVSVGHALFYARRFAEAARQIEKAIDHDPSYDYGRITLSKVLAMQERYEEAWRVADRIGEPVRSSAEGAALRAWLYGRQRRIEEGRREVAKASDASSIALAVAWAALGESETALKVLEDATRAKEPNVVYVKVSPLLDPIRGPRLDRICRQIGLSGCAASR